MDVVVDVVAVAEMERQGEKVEANADATAEAKVAKGCEVEKRKKDAVEDDDGDKVEGGVEEVAAADDE